MGIKDAIKKLVSRWNMEVLENYELGDITIPLVLNGSYAIYINESEECLVDKQLYIKKWFDENYPDNGLTIINTSDDVIESLAMIIDRLVAFEDLSSWNYECRVFNWSMKEKFE